MTDNFRGKANFIWQVADARLPSFRREDSVILVALIQDRDCSHSKGLTLIEMSKQAAG